MLWSNTSPDVNTSEIRCLKPSTIALLRKAINEFGNIRIHGPFAWYAKLRVAHALGIPGTFSPPPTPKETASYRSRHASRPVRHARPVMHVGIDNPQWRGKCSQHSRCMHNPQFCLSGKRSIEWPTIIRQTNTQCLSGIRQEWYACP